MLPSWALNDDSNLPAFFHVRSADGSAGYSGVPGLGGSAPAKNASKHQPQAQQQQQQQNQQQNADRKDKQQQRSKSKQQQQQRASPTPPAAASAAAAAAPPPVNNNNPNALANNSLVPTTGKELAHSKRLWGAPYYTQVHMDQISAFSVTQYDIADEMTSLILHRLPGISASSVITDGTACVGGNTVSFAKLGFQLIHSIELDEARCRMCYHNVELFRRLGAFASSTQQPRIEIYHGDCMQLMTELHQDVIFLDPPWGGKDYKSKNRVLLFLSGMSLAEIVRHAARHAKYVALKLPVNAELDFLSEFDVLVQRQVHNKILFLAVKQKQPRPLPMETKRVADILARLVKQPKFHDVLEKRL